VAAVAAAEVAAKAVVAVIVGAEVEGFVISIQQRKLLWLDGHVCDTYFGTVYVLQQVTKG